MFTVFDIHAARRPFAVRRILTAATLAAIPMPTITVLAILHASTAVAVLAALASALLYTAGYVAAAVQDRRLRATVADAHRDDLTGLPTRVTAERLLHAATRAGTALTVALADIDGLHAVNANFGHAAGDQYLAAVAARLARAVPPGGCLVRQGGDEFTLLAPNTDPNDLATAIGAAMSGPDTAVIAGHRIQPRASVGIATSDGGDAHHARARADAAMYQAKAAGGNHTLIYQPDRDGEPHPDGTRPATRRRDLNPAGAGRVAWQPAARDELLAFLWSAADARTVHHALCTARDRWAQAGAAARTTATAHRTAPDRMNIEPTPAGYRAIAGIAATEQASYARLADRMQSIIGAADAVDATGHTPLPSAGPAGTLLVGISAAFTAIEIESLVHTAAEVICDCQVCRLVRALSGSL